MGLLDEAIRDHLELKRRSGADPDEIARVEREALRSPQVERPATPAGFAAEDPDEVLYEDAAAEPDHGAEQGPGPMEPASVDGLSERRSLAGAGQETAEIDMQSVLDELPEAADAASPEGPAEGEDWQIPGQERMSFE